MAYRKRGSMRGAPSRMMRCMCHALPSKGWSTGQEVEEEELLGCLGAAVRCCWSAAYLSAGMRAAGSGGRAWCLFLLILNLSSQGAAAPAAGGAAPLSALVTLERLIGHRECWKPQTKFR